VLRLTSIAWVAAFAGLAASITAPLASAPDSLDAAAIVKRSVAANQRDWQAAPNYDCFERDRTPGKTVVYKVLMIEGSPFLERIPGEAHAGAAQLQREQRAVDKAIAKRRAETAEERASRMREYQNERERDRLMLEQIAEAFTFRLQGRKTVNGRSVYVIDATPRAGYSPPNAHSKALTGMEGTLWIDAATFNWVKVTARVTHSVSIYGFVAVVEPGTSFEMDKTPVRGDIWQPTHFAQHAQSRVLGLISHNREEDIRYWGYVPANNGDPLKR
jgi:hypothetical protein